MKTIIFIPFAALLLTISCRSVEKLIDQGDYESALKIAAKRLHGDKSKKTKHIKALEEAYFRINEGDLVDINYFKSLDDLESWERIYDIAFEIDSRQAFIAPLLPLVSKDGYEGHFPIFDARGLMIQSKAQIKQKSYHRGIDLLNTYEKHGWKYDAREAHYYLTKTNSIDPGYRDVIHLLERARLSGQEHILLNAEFSSRFFLPSEIDRYLGSLRLVRSDKDWVQFYNDPNARKAFDYEALLSIEEVELSPEYEKERIYVETKEVEEGWRYILDENGNVAKDSLGNDITTPDFVTVRARINELYREKRLVLRGQIELMDKLKNIRSVQPLFAETYFEDYSCRIRGDRRALTEKTRKRDKAHPHPFPLDIEMLYETTDRVKDIYEKYVNDVLAVLIFV